MSNHTRRGAVLIGLLAVSLLTLASMASAASAKTFVVNALGDETDEGGCLATNPCTLRDAINRSNEEQGADTIEFGVEGRIELAFSPLPAIYDPLTIDATTVPGYLGRPLVEIDGSAVSGGEGSTDGLAIYAAPTTVEGLAIGNFDIGIYTEVAGPVQICASHLGTDMSGTEAKPNLYGIETGLDSVEARIGADCPGGVGNLISGNEYFGIADGGQRTEIVANRIGIDAFGFPLPNGAENHPEEVPGGAGVLIRSTATGAYVGPGEAEPGNTIAFNQITGILVAAGAQAVTIGGNSIYSNAGLGIAIEGEKPPLPVLGAARSGPIESLVDGTLAAEPSESYVVEFFAGDTCDPSGFGEGRTPIGGEVVKTSTAGAVSFSAGGLDPLPSGQAVVTATATPTGSKGSTSEFSKCVTAELLKPVPHGPPPPAATNAILPVNGQSIVVEPQSGTILIQLPGETGFHPLKAGEEIPVGSLVDATKGKVTLTSIDASGKTQTAVFFGGIFQVAQREGSGLVVLSLRGGDFSSCGARGSTASASKKAGRHLWGSGKGNFRSEGKHGSATVRGTIWLTEDRCDGTFFRVRRGVVTIRDFAAHRFLQLPAGKSYLAG